ncbi:MAG: hypothetical protein R3F54_30655 [Alphaproteobacteria bacterium]
MLKGGARGKRLALLNESPNVERAADLDQLAKTLQGLAAAAGPAGAQPLVRSLMKGEIRHPAVMGEDGVDQRAQDVGIGPAHHLGEG